jgi:capsular exopolysaccharide synthesis family protein
MGKVFEALEKARQERNGLKNPQLDIVPFPGQRPASHIEFHAEKEMLTLFRNIDAQLENIPNKVIQFIGAKRGEGTSTIIRDFAMVSAARLGKSVLLLDADHQNPSQHLFFRADPRFGLEEIVRDKVTFEKAFFKIGDDDLRLCVYPSPQNSSFFRKFLYSPEVKEFWVDLRKMFDLILIDSAPAATSPDSIMLSRFADGVVLVLEAEKTRRPVAENLKNQIARNGGNLVGIVFNKHRHHIPDFIYKRL